MLAWVTGQIDDSLRQKLEFVLEENRVYRALLDRHSPHWRLEDTERKTLAERADRWADCWPWSLPLLHSARQVWVAKTPQPTKEVDFS